MRSTVESAVTDQVDAAYILNETDGMPFEAAEGGALARVPGVNTASHVRVDKALVAGEEKDVTGGDPATIARFYRFKWSDGSDEAVAQLGADGALVTQTYAEDQDLSSSEASTTRPRSSRCSARSASAGRRSTRRSRSRRTGSPSSTPGRTPTRRPSAAAADFSDASVHTGAAFTVVAILAGLAAAIMPARRASRLNVLDALHYE